MNLGARVKGFHACYAHLHNESDSAKPSADAELVFGGRSMGARAAVMAASEITGQSAGGGKTTVRLVLVSYPLVGPKGELRDQILLDLAAGVQVFFVSGDRDAMCPLDRLEEVMRKMTAKSQLLVVKGADHGMKTRPAGAEKEVGEELGRVAAKWVQRNVRDEVLFIGE
jgi:predicted alpha/beta-hydrolase family hydrolase